MIVYHFTSAEFALKALRDRRLKIARINELNDPFQLLAGNSFHGGGQSKLEAFRNKMNGERGIVCFSKNYADPMLWSHYADHHHGVALVFEIPDDQAIVAHYQPERFRSDVDAAMQRGEFDELDFTALIAAKFPSVQYENEVRLVCGLNDHFCQMDSKGKKVYFESLRLESYGVDALKLIGLIRGAHCDLKPADIASELLAVDLLLVQDARLDLVSFRVVADESYPVAGVRTFSACCFRV